MKHRLKMWLREAWARLLYHTGLHALVNRVMPVRLTILAGHCVAPCEGEEVLPGDMKIGAESLRRLLGWLAARYETCTVADGVERLRSRSGGRSLVALSMDDGYRDNYEVLAPLLAEMGIPATIYLETRPLDERRPNWNHKLFWLLSRMPVGELVRRYGELCREPAGLEGALGGGEGKAAYLFKRALKYEVDRDDRDRTLDLLFRELGGEEEALCRALHLSWEQARELAELGFEMGGHTRSHPVLARLDADELDREIAESTASLRRELGERALRSFAYPYGRRWDVSEEAVERVRAAGYRNATTTHAGVNRPDSDPLRLHRLMIHDGSRLHLIAAEACGGFELLRRIGVDLSE